MCRNPCENTRLAGRQPKWINMSGTDLCELIFDQDDLGSTQAGQKPVAMVSNNTSQQGQWIRAVCPSEGEPRRERGAGNNELCS